MTSGTSSKSRSKKPVNGSTVLTPKLDQTLVVAKDLSKQPTSKYILITNAGTGRPNYYAVDSYVLVGDHVISFNRKDETVYTCRVREGMWALVARDAVGFCTEKDLTDFTHKDALAQDKYLKELDPEGYKVAQEEAAAQASNPFAMIIPKGSGGHSHAEAKTDDRPVPGQYI